MSYQDLILAVRKNDIVSVQQILSNNKVDVNWQKISINIFMTNIFFNESLSNLNLDI